MTINLNVELDIDDLDIDYNIRSLGLGGSYHDGSVEDCGKVCEIHSIMWNRRNILWDLGEKELEKIREYLLERGG